MFAGLGRFIVRRKKSVLILFIIGILAAGGVGSLAFSKLDSGGYSDLGSDSAKAYEYVTEKFKVLTGLRWSWQESDVTTTKEVIGKVNGVDAITTSLENATPTTGSKTINSAYSPKIGLVFQPNKDLSL